MMREIINNLIYQLYVNKSQSRTQKEEDDINEVTIDQALTQIKSELLGKLPKEMPEKELWALPKISLVHIAQGRNEVIAQIKQLIETEFK